LDKVPKMLAKGKLSFLPKRSGNLTELRQVFRRAEEDCSAAAFGPSPPGSQHPAEQEDQP
jgi:hypothetical protein